MPNKVSFGKCHLHTDVPNIYLVKCWKRFTHITRWTCTCSAGHIVIYIARWRCSYSAGHVVIYITRWTSTCSVGNVASLQDDLDGDGDIRRREGKVDNRATVTEGFDHDFFFRMFKRKCRAFPQSFLPLRIYVVIKKTQTRRRGISNLCKPICYM